MTAPVGAAISAAENADGSAEAASDRIEAASSEMLFSGAADGAEERVSLLWGSPLPQPTNRPRSSAADKMSANDYFMWEPPFKLISQNHSVGCFYPTRFYDTQQYKFRMCQCSKCIVAMEQKSPMQQVHRAIRKRHRVMAHLCDCGAQWNMIE